MTTTISQLSIPYMIRSGTYSHNQQQLGLLSKTLLMTILILFLSTITLILSTPLPQQQQHQLKLMMTELPFTTKVLPSTAHTNPTRNGYLVSNGMVSCQDETQTAECILKSFSFTTEITRKAKKLTNEDTSTLTKASLSKEDNNKPALASFSLVISDATEEGTILWTYQVNPLLMNSPNQSDFVDLIDIAIPQFYPPAKNRKEYRVSIVVYFSAVSLIELYDLSSSFSFTATAAQSSLSYNNDNHQPLLLTSTPFVYKYPLDRTFIANTWFAVTPTLESTEFSFWAGIHSQFDGVYPTGGFWEKDFDVTSPVFDEFSQDAPKGSYIHYNSSISVELTLYNGSPVQSKVIEGEGVMGEPASTVWKFISTPLETKEVQMYPNHMTHQNCILGSLPINMEISNGGLTIKGKLDLTNQDLDVISSAQLSCVGLSMQSPIIPQAPKGRVNGHTEDIRDAHTNLLGLFEIKVYSDKTYDESKIIHTYHNLTYFDTFAGFFPQMVTSTKIRRDVPIQYPPPLQQSMMDEFNNEQNDDPSHDFSPSGETFTSYSNLYIYDIIYPINDIQQSADLQEQISHHQWRSPAFYTKNDLCRRDAYPLYCHFPQDFTANLLKYVAMCPIQGDHVRTLPATIVDLMPRSRLNQTSSIIERDSEDKTWDEITQGLEGQWHQSTNPFEDFFRSEAYLYTPYFRLIFSDYRWLDHYFPYQLDPVSTLWLKATMFKFSQAKLVTEQFAFQSHYNAGNSKFHHPDTPLPQVLFEKEGLNDQYIANNDDNEYNNLVSVKPHLSSSATNSISVKDHVGARRYVFALTFDPKPYQPLDMQHLPRYSQIQATFLFNEGSFLGDFSNCESSTHSHDLFMVDPQRSYSTQDDEMKFNSVRILFSQEISKTFTIRCPQAQISLPAANGLQIENNYRLDALIITSDIYGKDYLSNPVTQILGSPLRSTRDLSSEHATTILNDKSPIKDHNPYPTSLYGVMKPGTKSFVLQHTIIRVICFAFVPSTFLIFFTVCIILLVVYDKDKGKLKPNFIIKVYDDIYSIKIGNRPNPNRREPQNDKTKNHEDFHYNQFNRKNNDNNNTQGWQQSGQHKSEDKNIHSFSTKPPTFIDMHFIHPAFRQRIANHLIGGGGKVVVDKSLEAVVGGEEKKPSPVIKPSSLINNNNNNNFGSSKKNQFSTLQPAKKNNIKNTFGTMTRQYSTRNALHNDGDNQGDENLFMDNNDNNNHPPNEANLNDQLDSVEHLSLASPDNDQSEALINSDSSADVDMSQFDDLDSLASPLPATIAKL